MAKTKYLTRTMKSTRASILCMDIETAEPLNKTVVLAGTFKTEAQILKEAKKLIEDDRIKAVSVSAVQTESGVYRMPEATFLSLAEKVEK